jgi:hypothetical protein
MMLSYVSSNVISFPHDAYFDLFFIRYFKVDSFFFMFLLILCKYCTAMVVLVRIIQYTTLFLTLFYLQLC